MTDRTNATLAHLCRHPIKSIGFEEIGSATLSPGRGLPFDRLWAVTHGNTAPPAREGGWAPKSQFVRGVAAPGLMAVTARLDEQGSRIELAHPEAGRLWVRPDDDTDATRLIEWLRPLWPAAKGAPDGIRRAAEGEGLFDTPQPYVSVLNLASLRALGASLGRELSIHRWRGNLWIDGLAPWAEFDLIGREMQIGEAVLRVDERITRCDATKANPETGLSDADTLSALEAGWGHRDLGVYCTVLHGGTVRPGDTVRVR